nr:DEAD/DEAH box helicase [Calothrix parietina FACHB-288]
MTDNKPTDYAAIIRAANQTVSEPPEWLTVGKHIYSPEYGVGEVMALLGRRLIVKFVEEVTPTQFGDWEEAISIGSIQSSNANLVSSTTLIEQTNTRAATVSERIHQIPHLAFQSIAQELIASITAVDIKNPNQGIVHTVPSDLPPALRLALQNNGITNIYSHQLEALTKLR